MPASIASVHAEALELQETLSDISTQIARGYGTLAAAKLNRIASGLASLVSSFDELDELRTSSLTPRKERSHAKL